MHPFLIAANNEWLSDKGFMGQVVNQWYNDSQEFVRQKLPRIIGVALIAFVLNRLLALVTSRMVRVAEQHAGDPRRVAQVRTLAGVARTTGWAIIGSIASLYFLDAVGFNLSPILASAGIAGVAVGLAAQSLVKDMLNGTLILIEDQFNVGDVVTLAGLTGTVELMTLRKTTVRGFDGTLYMIPNSQITTVANQSVDFSLATMNVSVDFSADPDVAMKLLGDIAMKIRNSPEYHDAFMGDPQILGVDSIKGSQLIIPVQFRTVPRQQFAPMREFQRQVRIALENHGMLPGDPGRVFNPGAQVQPSRTPSAEAEPPAPTDPTTIKPHESNPFHAE
jgi:moderate conductance mechanosensitive channel